MKKTLLCCILTGCLHQEDTEPKNNSISCEVFSEEIDSMKTFISVFKEEEFHKEYKNEALYEECNNNEIAIELSIQETDGEYFGCDKVLDFSNGSHGDIASVELTDSGLQVDISNNSETLVCMTIFTYWEGNLENEDFLWFN